MVKFNKVQYVEVIAQPGQTQIQFNPQTYLANKHCTSIETFSGADLTKSISGFPVASAAQIKMAYLTLYTNDVNLPLDVNNNGQGHGLWFRAVPLWSFHRVETSTEPHVKEIFQLMGQQITWEQSYLNIADGTVITAATAFIFAIGYE